jgi:pyruvate dehydrogenase E2 component (dihydrolipoamide acetyltransferase)
MSIEVKLPRLSDNMEEGTIIRWYKSVGDWVEEGEPLAEVETDKADVELEASDTGELAEIRVPEGESVPVGAVIAILKTDARSGEGDQETARLSEEEEEREALEEAAGEEAAEKVKASRSGAAAREASPRGREGGAAVAPNQHDEKRDASARAVRASPLAWRLAEEAGVNLDLLQGTGPGGRILKRDVEEAIRRMQPVKARERRREEESGEPTPRVRELRERPRAEAARPIQEVSRMRRAIARAMSEAKREIPHFYLTTEIDMSEAMKLRGGIKTAGAIPNLTVTHLIVKALAIALERHPRVNASWREDTIEFHDHVNIGVAVAVEDGLIVPVLRDASRLSLNEIAEGVASLTERARSGKFSGEALTGGTFSLSNLGALDVEELSAVINPPQSAILAVGSVRPRPVVKDGKLAIAQTMYATLSCDHRVLNGVEGARFLVEVKSLLENPVALVIS